MKNITMILICLYLNNICFSQETPKFNYTENYNQFTFWMNIPLYNKIKVEKIGINILKSAPTLGFEGGIGYKAKISEYLFINISLGYGFIPFKINLYKTEEELDFFYLISKKIKYNLNEYFILPLSLQYNFHNKNKLTYYAELGARLNYIYDTNYKVIINYYDNNLTPLFNFQIFSSTPSFYFSFFTKIGMTYKTRKANTLNIALMGHYYPKPVGKGNYSFNYLSMKSYGITTLHMNYIGMELSYGLSFLNKKERLLLKETNYKKTHFESIDYSGSIESFSLLLNNSICFPTKILNQKGIIKPQFLTNYIPELSLKYSHIFKNGWGISIELPIGLYSPCVYTDLSTIVPADTIWANGTKGVIPDGFGFMEFFYGFELKAGYLQRIHKHILIQPELGIQLMPFFATTDRFSKDWGNSINPNPPYDTNSFSIKYMEYKLVFNQFLYFVPDFTTALNFYVHGKNPSHNFVFGLNANLCFVNRMAWTYHTTENLAGKYTSSGKFNWKTSYIGIHVGYQFMYGKKK